MASDPFVKVVIEGFQILAKLLQSVPEMTIRAIFPWCFTPELYAAKPEYIQSLADFVRSRPEQPLSSFLQQSNAVLNHDVYAALERITGCAHYEKVEEFNQRTVQFLRNHTGGAAPLAGHA